MPEPLVLTDEISLSELRYLVENVQNETLAEFLESCAIQAQAGNEVKIVLTVKGW